MLNNKTNDIYVQNHEFSIEDFLTESRKLVNFNLRELLREIYLKYYVSNDVYISTKSINYLNKVVDRIMSKHLFDIDKKNSYLIDIKELKKQEVKLMDFDIVYENPHYFKVHVKVFPENENCNTNIKDIFDLMFKINTFRKFEILDEIIPCSSTMIVKDIKRNCYKIIGGVYTNFDREEQIKEYFNNSSDDNDKKLNRLKYLLNEFYEDHHRTVHAELHYVVENLNRLIWYVNTGYTVFYLITVRNGNLLPSRPCLSCRTMIKEFLFKTLQERSFHEIKLRMIYPLGLNKLIVEKVGD